MNSQVDVHPEDLLDRDRAGQLAADESKRLAQHTGVCASCAMIRWMDRDFAKERAPRAGDDALLARLADRALGGTIETAPPSSSYATRRMARRIGPLAIAATLLLAGTAATASYWTVRQLFVSRPQATALPTTSPAADEARRAAHRRPAHAGPPVASEPVPTPEGAPQVEQLERAEPRPTHHPLRAPSPTREPARTRPPTEETTADRLFASANEARRLGDLAESAKLYQQLQARYPGSREEVTSRVLLGRLLLDRGEDTPAALSLFSRYLAANPNGTLAEEARLGKALALMRLGRRAEERQAWQDLLSAHPNTVHAKRAETRLDELR